MIAHGPGAHVVLCCRDLDAAQDFFTRLGFRLDAVLPADAPRSLLMTGHGLAVCLERSSIDGGGHLRLRGAAEATLTAPNGALVEIVAMPVAAARKIEAVWAIHRAGEPPVFHAGRAGMLYRDLLPARLGGALVASHIRIPRGGPVADYVHFHRVRCQALYVLAGEVTVVYEDQGPPFAMRTGDCVLQPPGIRHRVLACSDGFEVIEVACPAEHVTIVDHELSLPSALRLDRRFAGQRFHRHTASAAAFADAVGPFAVRDTGIGQASGGAIGVRVLTSAAGFAAAQLAPAASIRLWYVARGAVTFAGPTIGGPAIDGESACAGDLCVLPPATAFSMRAATPVEVLEFELPREFGDGDLR